jgi:hypothetical protein
VRCLHDASCGSISALKVHLHFSVGLLFTRLKHIVRQMSDEDGPTMSPDVIGDTFFPDVHTMIQHAEADLVLAPLSPMEGDGHFCRVGFIISQ